MNKVKDCITSLPISGKTVYRIDEQLFHSVARAMQYLQGLGFSQKEALEYLRQLKKDAQ